MLYEDDIERVANELLAQAKAYEEMSDSENNDRMAGYAKGFQDAAEIGACIIESMKHAYHECEWKALIDRINVIGHVIPSGLDDEDEFFTGFRAGRAMGAMAVISFLKIARGDREMECDD